MTAFTWLAWRVLQRRRGEVKPGFVWLAIAASALLFGAGHLPAARVLLGAIDPDVLVFVLGVNAAFGVLFGWLYWKRGLEAAMIAHATTHLVSYAITQVAGRG
jgi:membrane protease YdiL (CAAX protease family)